MSHQNAVWTRPKVDLCVACFRAIVDHDGKVGYCERHVGDPLVRQQYHKEHWHAQHEHTYQAVHG